MDAESHTERRRRRDALLEQLLDLPEADRPAFVAARTKDDPELRQELEALMAAAGRMAGTFLEPSSAPSLHAAAPPQLPPGTTLGRYVIEGLLGSGGMSAVYAARDPMVGRTVAIKVLAPQAQDEAWRQRFFGELRILGRMSHDHVVRVYDFGEDQKLLYLVMERLEGEDLGKAISGGRTGDLSRKLDIARQIAQALRDVHAAGVVHRDLKPANVFVTLSGRVKLIDFGISRSHDGQALTKAGLVAGTPEYMAPERRTGASTSPLGDIYSYGMLLVELFRGTRSTAGPDPSSLPAGTPAGVADVIRRTTLADPAARIQTFDEVLALLPGLAPVGVRTSAVEPARPAVNWRGRTLAAAVVVAAVGLAAWRYTGGDDAPASEPLPTFEISQATSRVGTEQFPSLSPDGRWLLFDSDSDGNRDIYLQAVGGQSAVNLTKDTPEADSQAAFSPDGESIVFRSERQGGGLFIMGRTGESPRRISREGFNPAWSPDGRSIAAATVPLAEPFNRAESSRLFVVDVAAGTQRSLVDSDAMQPNWSPHGARVAYWAVDESSRLRDIWTVSVADGTRVRVTNDDAVDWNPVWAPSGRYLYFLSNRNGTMNAWRIRIDETTGRTDGGPELVTMPASSVGQLAIAASGTAFAFSTDAREWSIHRAAFDPHGQKLIGASAPLIAGTRNWRSPALSPDGTMLTFTSVAPQNEDLWIARPDGSGLTQLTNDAAFDRGPHWSPDGTRIVFYSNRDRNQQVWVINGDGSGLRRVSDEGGKGFVAPTWSADGRQIIASSQQDGYLVRFDPDVPWTAQTPERFVPVPGAQQTSLGPPPDGRQVGLGYASSMETYAVDPVSWRWTGLGIRPPVAPGTWLPGRRRYIGVCLDGSMCVADLDTKSSARVFALPTYEIASAELTRDARTVFFDPTRVTGDIYIARAAADQSTRP